MKLIDNIILAFPSAETKYVKLLVETTIDFEIYPNRNQIWASIFILSNASFHETVEILAHAKKDWRDVIIASGLAVDNWEVVAEKWLLKKISQPNQK